MEAPYNNRELDHYFKDLFGRMEKQDKNLETIKEQTIKTNGRVNKHDWNFKALWWGLGALWTLLLLGVPITYKIVINDLNYKIQTAVVTAVDNKIIKAYEEEN